jgi:hypothetical protein
MTNPPSDELLYRRGRKILEQALKELMKNGYGHSVNAADLARAVHDTYTPDISDSQWLAAIAARVLGHQLDGLLNAQSRDSANAAATEASFATLLHMVLLLGGRRPALGATGAGNFIATWTEGDDRLTIECKPDDHVRWVLVQSLDGQRETAAGETTARRLPEVLRPYDPPKRWFLHAEGKPPEG